MGASVAEPGTVIAGRYRVEKKLGEGGMGAVYLVRHIRTDEQLALKLLHAQVLRDESAVERFRQEARAPARINSEYVARVTDADTAPELEDAPFYVMEYLDGTDLEAIVSHQGPIAPALVVQYLYQAARALDKAHAMGIVHRDLKPENLFLTNRQDGSPCIKLIDFGIAKFDGVDAPSPMHTQAGYVVGTPVFMAPEQALGDVNKIGPRTDVWALGLVAFRLLVGQPFWRETTTAHLFAMILSDPIPAPSARGSFFGPLFDVWFSRCVARSVDDRFGSTGEAVIALAAALGVRLEVHPASSASFVAASDIYADGTYAPTRPPAASMSGPIVAASAGGDPRKPARIVYAAAAAGILVVLASFVVVAFSKAPTKAVGLAFPQDSVGTLAIPTTSANAINLDVAATASASTTPVAASPASRGNQPALTPRAGKPSNGRRTPEQKQRIDALQRLCDQGTYTPDECRAKYSAMMHDEP